MNSTASKERREHIANVTFVHSLSSSVIAPDYIHRSDTAERGCIHGLGRSGEMTCIPHDVFTHTLLIQKSERSFSVIKHQRCFIHCKIVQYEILHSIRREKLREAGHSWMQFQQQQ